MNKKIVFALVLLLAIILVGVVRFGQKTSPSQLVTSQQKTIKQILPSESLIEYKDPSGFSFNYPDDLSITKNEVDKATYADIQLYSKQISGSLNLKITDSKFAKIEDWLKLNKAASKESPKEVKLGNLQGLEIKTDDRLLLGALDQGILFTIEMPLIEQDYWMKVYSKVLTNFTFSPPDNSASQSSDSSDVTFEGEEVVE